MSPIDFPEDKFNPSNIFRFDRDTKTGFAILNFVAFKADMEVQNLINQLSNPESELFNNVVNYCKCSPKALLLTVESGYLTGKMFQAVLYFRSRENKIAFDNNAEWSGIAADVTIANAVNYFTLDQIDASDRARAVLSGNDLIYHPAFYKRKLNKVWYYFFGRNLLEMIEDEETGKVSCGSGDGKPLYKIMVEGMGLRFKDYYVTILNPKGKGQKWRAYTFTQVLYKSPLLNRAFDKYTNELVIMAQELAIEKELVYLDRHPNLTEEDKKAIRYRARHNKGGLYDKVSGMNTVEDLIIYFDDIDRLNGNQTFWHLPSSDAA